MSVTESETAVEDTVIDPSDNPSGTPFGDGTSGPETPKATAQGGDKPGEKSKPTPEQAAQESPQAEIARLKAEKADLNERMLRVAADFENYRRRVKKDIDDAQFRLTDRLLKEMLPVMDNLDRALDAAAGAKGDGSANALLDGVRLVQRQFLSALEKFDVKTFDALGKPFDPSYHEAVQQIDSDAHPPGTVATVFQRGYTLGSRLLRPALVVVVRGRATPAKDKANRADDSLPIDESSMDDVVI